MKESVLSRPVFEGNEMIFGKFKELFFVGIGGAGMSGIAEILHNLGYKISGSDINKTEVTEHLENLGVPVYEGHAGGNIGTSHVVVISSAVDDSNPEVIEARRRGLPVIKRAEMLGELMRLKYSIGISGTHGKTTTTSMIGKIMTDAELDPTVIVGGIVAGKGSGASLGGGKYMVAEADEYDKSFLSMFPSMAVITNIEPDHLDCYDGMEDLENSFLIYMNRVPFYGLIIYNNDDTVLKKLRDKISRASVSFGLSAEADYQVTDILHFEGGSKFSVLRRGEILGDVRMRIPGEHNIKNAAAAIVAASELEIDFEKIARSLSDYSGVNRRFQITGQVNNILLVDDYAHHPTEIKATLETAQTSYNRRIIVVFQPHLYSRTKQFYREFAESLKLADRCFLVDIYPAREKPVESVTSELISSHAAALGQNNIDYVGDKTNAIEAVLKYAKPGDMIITMGAGSVTLLNPAILKELKQK